MKWMQVASQYRDFVLAFSNLKIYMTEFIVYYNPDFSEHDLFHWKSSVVSLAWLLVDPQWSLRLLSFTFFLIWQGTESAFTGR
jgi:hypothetical protein